MAYTTIADVKVYLGVGIDDSADDSLIGLLVTVAQQAIDLFYGRSFEYGTATARRFHGINDVRDNRLWLDRDLCSITSIVNGNGETISAGQYTTVPLNETPYYAIQLKRSSGVNWEWEDDPEGAITVTGKWSYSVSAPVHVAQLCRWLVSMMFKGKDDVLQTGDSNLVGEAESILTGNLTPEIRLLMSFIPRRAVL